MTSSPENYNATFYVQHQEEALTSAKSIVPWILEFVGFPQSVVDVGCGTGEWLATFRQLGVADILGVDGEWVPPEHLLVPRHFLISRDLSEPLCLDRKFDLALSLETGEHLPPEQAAVFVESLTNLAPVVVFSAAIPYQPGVDHRNLQWPAYWANLFGRHGYLAIDCIRPRIWELSRIPYWYKQNMVLYAESEWISAHDRLKGLWEKYGGFPLPLVHPEIYTHLASRAK